MSEKFINMLDLYKISEFQYLHWFSWDNIIKILEEKIFPDVMLRTVIFAYSEDGEICWIDPPNLWKYKIEYLIEDVLTRMWCLFNIPPTAKVIWRRGHSLKSHPTDWWSRESNLRPLVYKASSLSTTPQWLLLTRMLSNPSHGRIHRGGQGVQTPPPPPPWKITKI